jgi:NAD(P)H dehydrogenase (quinone)
MIAVTAATGHLGRIVVEELLRKVPAGEVVAAVRNPDRARDLVDRGVEVRRADFDQPATLEPAFDGVEKLLFISGSEAGRRGPQHRAVVDAARKVGVKLVAYTSILHGDMSPLALAAEHKETEAALRASGLPVVLLRNSWYTENYTERLGPALQHGAILGAAGEGRIAAAARADYAAAAVAVLTTPGHEGKVYELGGDAPFTLAELAAEVSRQAGRPVVYRDLSASEFAAALQAAGVPPPVAQLYADVDVGISRGALDDRSGTLRRLIGRPTTPLAESVAAGLRAMGR